MKSKKVSILISEKRERIIIQRKVKRIVSNAFCKNCGETVEGLTLEEVALITEKDEEEIRRKV